MDWSTVIVKTFYNVSDTSIFIYFWLLLDHLFINESWKNVSQFPQNLLSSMLIIRNISWALNQHIRMISEGSCDTEDWSNSCWKFSFTITGLNYNILKYKPIHSFFSFKMYYLNNWFPLWLIHAFIYSLLPSYVHSQKLVVFGFDFKPSVPCHVEKGF